MIHPLPETVIRSLRVIDTCTAVNAIEAFDVQLRNEGFAISDGLQCQFPALGPMFGYAVTLRVRSANPPMEGGKYLERNDWWNSIDSIPAPRVVVIQDMDRRPGIGAFVGEVHAAILQALGCVGVVTDGAVRDLPGVHKRGFHFFSNTVSPSHAYVHIVEVGGTVEIAGLRIHPGDMLLGDQHGLVRIPPKVAPELPEIAARIRARERAIFDYCKSKEFSRAGLRELLNQPPA